MQAIEQSDDEVGWPVDGFVLVTTEFPAIQWREILAQEVFHELA